jgi:hypothetical protein|tara:strand:+ start:3955 stop:5121 length:1167 start_codon:yes stop_codon:yes gene_type:complete
MAFPAIPDNFQYLPSTSTQGTFFTTGFKSGLEYCGSYAIINVSFACDKNARLKIFQSPSQSDDEETLLYETNITAENYFFKRFQIQGQYFSIEVNNTSDPLVEGKINMLSMVSVSQQFAASTFLNSRMTIDEDTSLIRNGNSYHVDLVRGLHFDFKKVNIQGIMSTSSITSEETIGLGNNFTFIALNTPTNLRITGANDNQPAGTGARKIRIVGIDDTGTERDSIYDVNTGVGSTGIDFLCINRLIITSTGSLKHNEGLITLEESGSNVVINKINATENVSHVALYKVASNKQLILRDVNICGSAPDGTLRVIEMDSNGLEYSLGDFHINTNYQQITYTLDGIIDSGNIVKVNFIPTGGAPTGQVNINVNVNGVLCPLINNYPNNSFA